MTDNNISSIVKVLCYKRCSHFGIRLTLEIVEHSARGCIFNLATHGLSIFKNGYELDELRSFLNTEHCQLFAITKVDDDSVSKEEFKECDLYTLSCLNHIFKFAVPKKIGRKSVRKKADDQVSLYNQVFAIWLREIGSDKCIFSRGKPSLTMSRGGRFEAIKKAFTQDIVHSLEEAELAIIGCRNDMYRMGFSSNGEQNATNYCDLPSILRNRQSVEKLISKSKGIHYKEQLKMINQKNDNKQKLLEQMNLVKPSAENPTIDDVNQNEDWW